MENTHQWNSEQETLWNGRAGTAWVEEQKVLDQLFKLFEERLVEAVSAGNLIRRALDVGCGTGGTTLALARLLGKKGRAAGIDISGPMLAHARARAERDGTPVSFIHGDAQIYQFEPASFDIIVSRFGVMFFEDPIRAFRNLQRAAREGGELRFIAWRGPLENPFMTTAERAAASLLPNLPTRDPDAPGQFAFADRGRVSSILAQSGWTGIEIRPMDIDCTLAEKDLIRYFTSFGPLGRVFPEVDDRTRIRVIETVRDAFEPYVRGAEVRFTAACWMVSARALSQRQ